MKKQTQKQVKYMNTNSNNTSIKYGHNNFFLGLPNSAVKMITQYGLKVVYGARPTIIKKVEGVGNGQVRYRFRANGVAKIYVRTSDGINEYIIVEELDGSWSGLLVARNAKALVSPGP